MEYITQERIKRIGKLDSDKLPIILIKAMEACHAVSDIIDCYTERYSDSKSNIVKSYTKEFGEAISNEYLNLSYATMFEIELLKYIGFEEDDEVAGWEIFEYCSTPPKNKNIRELKERLIECAIRLEEFEKPEPNLI